MHGVKEWVRRDQGTFVLRDREEPYWARCLFQFRDQLRSLEEHRQLVRGLRADPEIASQLGKVVGTALVALCVTAEGIAGQLLTSVIEKCGGSFRFAEESFDEVFRKVDADAHQTEFDFVLLAPLWRVSVASTPLQLSPKVQIGQMTDSEIVRCLQMGFFPGPLIGGDVHLSSGLAVRISFRSPKQIGEATGPDDLAQALEAHAQREEQLRSVLHALRLFKPGRVAAPGFLTFSEQWPLDGGTNANGLEISLAYRNQYELTEHEAADFCAFWTDLKKTQNKQFIASAVRRFGYAGERRRPDDRLVDLMIAAESLFLSDAGDPSDRGELTYRMAMRFAFFAEWPGYNREQLFKQMRYAYRVRSAIVHGGNPRAENLKSKDGTVTFDQFVDLLEQLLRGCLKSAIKKASSGDPKFPHWERLILCGRGSFRPDE
jgi:hypothetical protein